MNDYFGYSHSSATNQTLNCRSLSKTCRTFSIESSISGVYWRPQWSTPLTPENPKPFVPDESLGIAPSRKAFQASLR
ncbi:hypothetical protein TNCT_402351 [Trichonephila clavata]|uniref:Uncharacterized protein n=1 Tax=Trichonephila clavata TaxID=2740835 RepID=A0A8X6JGH4_TRICU|nr:hypothetical protein TNCT_402351 [Trichonephila clavata]